MAPGISPGTGCSGIDPYLVIEDRYGHRGSVEDGAGSSVYLHDVVLRRVRSLQYDSPSI